MYSLFYAAELSGIVAILCANCIPHANLRAKVLLFFEICKFILCYCAFLLNIFVAFCFILLRSGTIVREIWTHIFVWICGMCEQTTVNNFRKRVNFFRKLSTFSGRVSTFLGRVSIIFGRVSIILGKLIKNCLLILGKSQQISGKSKLF